MKLKSSFFVLTEQYDLENDGKLVEFINKNHKIWEDKYQVMWICMVHFRIIIYQEISKFNLKENKKSLALALKDMFKNIIYHERRKYKKIQQARFERVTLSWINKIKKRIK